MRLVEIDLVEGAGEIGDSSGAGVLLGKCAWDIVRQPVAVPSNPHGGRVSGVKEGVKSYEMSPWGGSLVPALARSHQGAAVVRSAHHQGAGISSSAMTSTRNPAPADFGNVVVVRDSSGATKLRDEDAETNADEAVDMNDFFVLCPAIGVRAAALSHSARVVVLTARSVRRAAGERVEGGQRRHA
jgi:hypothetical protein